jgi:acyl dehydratase
MAHIKSNTQKKTLTKEPRKTILKNEYFNHYWEDFILGERYSTRTRLVTLEDHLQFCKLVGYEVPLFIDENFAKASSNNGLICPSHLIMSFTTAMTGNLFSKSIIALLTIENARFLAPVRPGDMIRTEVEILSKRETSKIDRGIVVFRDLVFNQHNDLVFQNDKTALIKRI